MNDETRLTIKVLDSTNLFKRAETTMVKKHDELGMCLRPRKPVVKDHSLDGSLTDQGIFLNQSYEDKISYLENELSLLSTELLRLSGRRKNGARSLLQAKCKGRNLEANRAAHSGDDSSDGLSLLLSDMLNDSANELEQESSRDDLSELLADSLRNHGPRHASPATIVTDDLSELLAEKFRKMDHNDISTSQGIRVPPRFENKKRKGDDRRKERRQRRKALQRRAEELEALFLSSEISIEIPSEPEPILPMKTVSSAYTMKGTLNNLLQVSSHQYK